MSSNFVKTELPCPINVSSLVTLHKFNYAPDFLFTGEKHDFWEMAYVENGEVGVVAESTGYTLHAGDSYYIPADAGVYTIDADEDMEFLLSMI